jgi:hypothetical protein
MPGRPLATVGTIEGFYGPPWTHEQRLAHLRFAAGAGFDTVVYAPKDDPYHRRLWRAAYPEPELTRIAELAAAATGLGLRFVYALHPALDMRYAEDAEHARLAAKAGQLHGAGVRAFALLFDDVPYEVGAADAARFGAGAAGLGAAHGTTASRFVDGFLARSGIEGPLLVCPTDYAGVEATPYRDAFAATAPADVHLTWTGRDVVVGTVTRAEVDAAFASYRRPLVLWDNFPVNDFEPSRLFLGPLTGRATDLDGSALVGVIGNAMIEEAASRIPLATTAAWARDPHGYRPATAHAAAIAAAGATALAPFVRVCSSWPPSADQDPELTAACSAALAGDRGALALVVARLTELADCLRDPQGPPELLASLRPWLTGAAATARAGLAACALLAGDGSGGTPAALAGTGTPAGTRAALAEAEEHYANVLRPLVPSFVRAVLDRVAPVEPTGPPVAVLGRPDDPAVRATVELLASLGCAGRPISAGPGVASVEGAASLEGAALVVVTASAAPAGVAAVAAAPVPVLAWGGLVELGMASEAPAAMLFDGVTITEPGDPLAAGLAGPVPLYRGAGYVQTAVVGPDARVVARGPDAEERAVAFRYEPGAELASGAPAPAARIGLFPTRHGPAPWLLHGTGRALFAAALRLALTPASSRS